MARLKTSGIKAQRRTPCELKFIFAATTAAVAAVVAVWEQATGSKQRRAEKRTEPRNVPSRETYRAEKRTEPKTYRGRETYRAEKRTEASQLYAHKVGYDDAWRDARRFVEKTAGALRRCDKPPILLSDSVPRMPSLGYASRRISRMSTAGGYRGLSKGLQSLLDHVVF